MDWSALGAGTKVYAALSGCALAAAAFFGVPLGIAASRTPARWLVLGLANVARVVPSLALLTFMLPLFGVGFIPAAIALALLALAPITINTDIAFRAVPAAAREAAAGLGMTACQRFLRVEYPLALPLIFAGLRIAAAEVIASAVLASFIGAGGLGEYVTTGLQANQPARLWTGVAAIAAFALIVELAFAAAQRRLLARQ